MLYGYYVFGKLKSIFRVGSSLHLAQDDMTSFLHFLFPLFQILSESAYEIYENILFTEIQSESLRRTHLYCSNAAVDRSV